MKFCTLIYKNKPIHRLLFPIEFFFLKRKVKKPLGVEWHREKKAISLVFIIPDDWIELPRITQTEYTVKKGGKIWKWSIFENPSP